VDIRGKQVRVEVHYRFWIPFGAFGGTGTAIYATTVDVPKE
jgi:hypothetical protein